jgi:hypothetical protein
VAADTALIGFRRQDTFEKYCGQIPASGMFRAKSAKVAKGRDYSPSFFFASFARPTKFFQTMRLPRFQAVF